MHIQISQLNFYEFTHTILAILHDREHNLELILPMDELILQLARPNI